jgi:hypothetical protein
MVKRSAGPLIWINGPFLRPAYPARMPLSPEPVFHASLSP